MNLDDLYSYSLWGLTQAARAYDPSRGTAFRTYASQWAMFLAIDQMRKEGVLQRSDAKKRPRMVSLSVDSDEGSYEIELPDSRAEQERRGVEARDACKYLMRRLRERDRQLLMMYYADGLTFREISKVLCVSESYVCLRRKSLLDWLRQSASKAKLA
jgi:RNA polymerase sigma factor (sigma-70 family)